MKLPFPLLFALLPLLSSCVHAPQPMPAEPVMTPGMVIDAETSEGKLRIRYVDPWTREYSWGERVKTFTHQPREKRWFGSLGMYRPYGDRSMHAILEEGQQHFSTTAEAYTWIAKQERHCDCVWTSDGLMVGWKEQARPGDGFVAFSAEVWQLYVQGAKAWLRNGSSNEKIQVSAGRRPDA